jgi:mono/diheme cytochrome c family protein
MLEQGSALYAEHCASCHGADLRGTDKGPSHLSVIYEPNHHSDDSFRSAIANGAPQHHFEFGDMAPVEGLSADDVEAVIAFVRAEQQRLGFE